MTLAEYFKQEDSPAAGSPTGLAMAELLKHHPKLTFDSARQMVNEIGASIYKPAELAKILSKRLARTA